MNLIITQYSPSYPHFLHLTSILTVNINTVDTNRPISMQLGMNIMTLATFKFLANLWCASLRAIA